MQEGDVPQGCCCTTCERGGIYVNNTMPGKMTPSLRHFCLRGFLGQARGAAKWKLRLASSKFLAMCWQLVCVCVCANEPLVRSLHFTAAQRCPRAWG